MGQDAVVRGGENAAVKGDVASRDQLRSPAAGLERRAGRLDPGLLLRRGADCRQTARRRLDDHPELDQIEGVRQPLTDRIQPAQHLRVEQVPVAARADPRAAARARF